MNEQLKLDMVNRIKTAYGTTGSDNFNLEQVEMPCMNLEGRQQKALDNFFKDNNNGADARISKLQQAITRTHEDYGEEIVKMLKKTFDPSWTNS